MTISPSLWIKNLDLNIFHTLNSAVGYSPYLDLTIIIIAKYYIYVLCLIVAYFIWKDFLKNSRQKFAVNLIALLLTTASTTAITTLIRNSYHHLRPFIAMNIPHLLTEQTYSFPSGHTIFIFGVATAMYFYSKRLALFLYLSGLIVGIARIVAGVHYPFDIFGGIVLGILIGLIVRCIVKNTFKFKTVV